jgi:MFS family permease
MVGVMVMTPVHLGHGGASLRVVGVVISVHIAGMYAASPVFGWLSDRAGRVPVILLGLVLFAASLALGAVADAGQHELVGVSLALLGLGWSASLVAGSTLLTESVPAAVRTSVQGVSDLTMGLSAAVAGAVAGPLLAVGGYRTLTLTAAVLLLPVIALAVGERLARESRSRAVGGAV